MENIGNRIKARRKEIGMSAEKLADIINVSPATIYRYESNYIMNMGLDKLETIANALHVTPAYLMGWDQQAIETVAEVINDKNESIDKSENEFKSFMEEFCELQLTKEEMQEVFEYALYIKSKRK